MPPPPSSSWGSSATALARAFGLLLLDLDGVVYVGPNAVPGAAESLARATDEGVRCRYVTNNAARPPAVVADHLRELGIAAADDEVVTSAQEGAELLAGRLAAGAQVLAVGGPGVSAALVEVGLVPVGRYDVDVAGVLQGYGPDVGWRDLAEASYAVTGGAVWVATNPDLTVPTPRGTAPGNGQLTAVVARTTGVAPTVTGKPGPGLFQTAIRRAAAGGATAGGAGADGAAGAAAAGAAAAGGRPAGAEQVLVVGDRLDTDIAGAVAAGLESLLVLTGVSGLADLLAADPAERPTYLAADLSGLWEPHPEVAEVTGWWVCGSARARGANGRLELGHAGRQEGSDGPDHIGDGRGLDAWRAASAAAWAAADRGDKLDLTDVIASLDRAAG